MTELSTSGAEYRNSLVCTLTSMDPQERGRHEQVIQQLTATIQEVQELPEGYGFRLPGGSESILTAVEFIGRERLCCSFFNFELAASNEDGPIWLRLTGHEGVKDFLRRTGLVQSPLRTQ